MGKEAILIGHSYDIEVIVDIDGLPGGHRRGNGFFSDQIIDGNVRVDRQTRTEFRARGGVLRPIIRSSPPPRRPVRSIWRSACSRKNAKLPHRMDFALVKWG